MKALQGKMAYAVYDRQVGAYKLRNNGMGYVWWSRSHAEKAASSLNDLFRHGDQETRFLVHSFRLEAA